MSYTINTINFNPANQSAFGTLETSEPTPVFQGDWVYGINKQLWQNFYYFTVTTPATPPLVGDVYTNNNATFIIVYSSGTVLIANGSSDPTATGNLTRSSGAGTTPIAYSAFTVSAGITIGTGATIDTNASRLRMQSGTGSANVCYLQSRKPVRYRAGEGMFERLTPLFTAGVVNNLQMMGIGAMVGTTIQDGYFFGYQNTTYGIFHYNAGSLVNFYSQANWNGDKGNGTGTSGITLDPTKGTPCMIKYPYLGYGDISFWFQNPTTGVWILAHTIQYANANTAVQLSNPTLYALYYTANTGNTTNQTMYSGSIGCFISGVRSFISNPKWGMDSTKTAFASGAVLAVKNCSSYNGVVNRNPIRLNSFSVANGTTANNDAASFRIRINPVLGGTPSWTAINGTLTNSGATITSGNSIASYDTATTTVTGGDYIYNLSVGSGGGTVIDLTPYEIYINPNEVMTIECTSQASSTVSVSVNATDDI